MWPASRAAKHPEPSQCTLTTPPHCRSRLAGQGLLPAVDNTLGATSLYQALASTYGSSKQFQRAFSQAPKSSCAQGTGLCSSADANALVNYAILAMATAPESYSALNQSDTGGLKPYESPGSQDSCNTCVPFAVAALAGAAVSYAVRKDAGSFPGLSVQDLHHCNQQGMLCGNGWRVLPALTALQERTTAGDLQAASCLPYKPDVSGVEPQKMLCTPRSPAACSAKPLALNGSFEVIAFTDAWIVQRHIRHHGGALTRILVYPGFKEFFRKTPQGIYNGPTGSNVSTNDATEHAVVLVGYNNIEQYWLCRNSWGNSFADAGYFRVRPCCIMHADLQQLSHA